MRTLTICGTPIAAYTIVTPERPAPAVTTAAEFLRDTIERACGVTLSITTAPADHSICLGIREPSPEVKWDGFRMSTDTANLYLDGNIPRGTLYAAYDFAETYLGRRQFTPELEVISAEGEAAVEAGLDRVDNPTFEVRRCNGYEYFYHPAFAAQNRINSNGSGDFDEALGGSAEYDGNCHSFGALLPAALYYDEHPEYYALVYPEGEESGEGKRLPCKDGGGPGQLCLSNPDVLRIVTENVLRDLRAHPEKTIAEVSQCDSEHYCRCEKCAAIDAEEESHAGTMIRFVNAVAEAVEKEFPHVLVRTFAYVYTSKPPKKTKARHNVLIRYCTMDACFRHALDDPRCATNSVRFYRELTEWKDKCSQISVWDYMNNWKAYIAPFPNLYSIRDNARFFSECHAVRVFEEEANSAREGGTWPELRAYLAGKALWNAHITLEEYDRHIDEFLAAYYGRGWRELRRYLDMAYEATEDRCCTCSEAVDRVFVNPLLPGVTWEERHDFYERPYQTEFPDHGLVGLCRILPEAFACFDAALAMAETDEERARIEKSRFSLTFMKLFCLPHDKNTMTAEEQQAYEAEVAAYYETKKKLNYHYNIYTYHKDR